MDKQTSLVKITPEQIAQLDQLAKEGELAMMEGSGSFSDMFRIADAMQRLRESITQEMMRPIMALANTTIGFQTDRDPNKIDKKTDKPNIPYPEPVIKDCMIEAVMNGLRVVGNEMNVISGRMYPTLNGFRGKLKRLKGLTDFTTNIGIPRSEQGGAIVDIEATWKYNGKPDSLKASIPVKTDSYSGADQIIGKATRKFLKRVWEQVTGVELKDGSVDDLDEDPKTSREEDRAFLKAKPVYGATPKDPVPTEPAKEQAALQPKIKISTDNPVDIQLPFEKSPEPPAQKPVEAAAPIELSLEEQEIYDSFQAALTLKGVTESEFIKWAHSRSYAPADAATVAQIIKIMPKRMRTFTVQMSTIAEHIAAEKKS